MSSARVVSRRAAGGGSVRPRRASLQLAAGWELESTVGYMLRRAQLAVFADLIAQMSGPVTRLGEFSVMHIIGRRPGLSQGQISETLGIQRANLVALLHALESKGLARREASLTDRRSNSVYLTPAGERALHLAAATQQAHEEKIARLLGPRVRADLPAALGKLAGVGRRRPTTTP